MKCENPPCGRHLDADYLGLITSARVIRFCSMECLIESPLSHQRALWRKTEMECGLVWKGKSGSSDRP
jgi:hypothetical protein